MAIIKKLSGHFLEDFKAGQVFRHKGGKTINEGLFNDFTEFNFTTNPLSKNAEYAKLYGYQGLVCPAGLVMNVVFSQTVNDISENARANLGYINMTFGAPVYIGDTLEAETTILAVQPSSKDPDRGVVHVATVGRNQRGEVVIAFERKVQIWKNNLDAPVDDNTLSDYKAPEVHLWLPAHDAKKDYKAKAHLSSSDTYFEDFTQGDTYEHSRGRVVGQEHVFLTARLDNTSQLHCNQTLIDRFPDKYIGGKLLIYGGIPFNLAQGLSCVDIADNSLGDVIYPSGKHTGPLFEGDTVFASTEISGKDDYPGREDLGLLKTVLRAHKFVRKDGEEKKVDLFELTRYLAVKRRSHYA